MTYTGGTYFKGTLQNGNWYTGYGYQIFSNGNTYEGGYYQGYRDGNCTYYNSDTGYYWKGTCERGEYTLGTWYDALGNVVSVSDNPDGSV